MMDEEDKTRYFMSCCKAMADKDVKYSELNDDNKKTFEVYFTSNKEKWNSIHEMISVTQAKINLIGWNIADAIKKSNDDYKTKK